MRNTELTAQIRQARCFAICLLMVVATLLMSGCGSHKPTRIEQRRAHLDSKITKGDDSAEIGKAGKGEKKYRGSSAIVKEAYSWLGTPYRYAGKEKGKGTDCSGMVMTIYERVAGKKLPRNSAQQAEHCRKIKSREVKPGDLVFFATGKDRRRISHVGIMIDDIRFIHSSQSKGVVISEISGSYYPERLIMYGRVP